jgi:septal ring factor EnvC (AmiA/AmiB activator)
MTKSKFYLITLLTAILLSVVLGSSSSFASDTSSINQTEPTISVPVSQWNELKSNNEKALSLIEASSIPLTEAQSLVMKQQQELIEARNTIDKLTTELDKAKADLVKQEVTLSEMSSSLIELKGQIENEKKTIKRLRMQRNLSQILGAGATIGVVIHR